MISPSGTLAIVEFKSAGRAKTALEKLQFQYIRGLPLYIEFSPTGLIEKQKDEVVEVYEPEVIEGEEENKVVFVKNLNF